jgi:AraC-like DNA-binding protein
MQQVATKGAVPAIARFTFSDPAELRDVIHSAEVKIVSTGPGPFRAELTTVNFPRLSILHGRISLPLVAHTAQLPGRSSIFFLADAEQQPMHANGKEFPPSWIAHPSRGSEDYLRAHAESRWAVVYLPTSDLSAASLALRGRELSAPATTQLSRPTTAPMARLLRLSRLANRFASDEAILVCRPQVEKAIEQALLEATVGCLDTGDDADLVSENPGYDVVMRRFERALEAHEGEPLFLSELCAEIGVSDRVLRRHCQKRLGIGPRRYLWLRRMHMARRALALADPSSTNVTEIATGNGFAELGRFAVQYRALFGEMPSATLRRAPELAPVKVRNDPSWIAGGKGVAG